VIRHRCRRVERRGRAVLAVFVAASLLLLAAPSARARDAAEDLSAVRAILRTLDHEPPPPMKVVIDKLVERGAAGALVEVGRELTGVDQIDASVEALKRLDSGKVEPFLLAVIDGIADFRSLADAYRHLGEEGTPESVPFIIKRMPKNDYRMKRTVERALIRLFRRHDSPTIYDEVAHSLGSASLETRGRVLCGIGETASSFGLEFLAQYLGRFPDLDHTVVTAITQMPVELVSERVLLKLRPYLQSPNMNLRREAITALAVFSDVDTAKTLIENLSDDQRGIRGNSLWALQKMSGLKFPESPERWKTWYEEEVAWWEAEGEGLLAALESGTDLQIIEALRWLSEHRLYRTKISGALTELLDHPSEEVRAAAKAALERLGLKEKKRESDTRTAFASRGFEAIPPDKMPEFGQEKPGKSESNRSGSSMLVALFGLAVLCVLVLRVFGLTLVDRLSRMFSGGSRREGPITLTLGKDRQPPED
jgi:HEAT repeat protein